MFKSVISAVALAACLTGCVIPAPGNNNSIREVTSQAEARALVPLGLTQAQVRAKLGEPTSMNTMGTRTTWGYLYQSARLNPLGGIGLGRSPIDGRAVIIGFNTSGRVNSVDFNRQTY